MKLRYFRIRNVLSFGDYETEINFGSFNIIAGPNDSGKTNLFRALKLIEDAFEDRKPSLDEIIFKGYNYNSLNLEVGVELTDLELELLVTIILCSEIWRVQQQEEITVGIKEKSIGKASSQNTVIKYFPNLLEIFPLFFVKMI